MHIEYSIDSCVMDYAISVKEGKLKWRFMIYHRLNNVKLVFLVFLADFKNLKKKMCTYIVIECDSIFCYSYLYTFFFTQRG